MVSALRPAALCTDPRAHRPPRNDEGPPESRAPILRLGHCLGGTAPRNPPAAGRWRLRSLDPGGGPSACQCGADLPPLSPKVPHLFFEETGLRGLSLRVLTV